MRHQPTARDKAELAAWVRDRRTSWERAAIAQGRIQGRSLRQIALNLGVAWRTAKKWASAFDASGVPGLRKERQRGPRPRQLEWDFDEKAELQRIQYRPQRDKGSSTASSLAYVALAVGQGLGNRKIAKQIRWKPHRVARWRARFLRKRLDCIPEKWRVRNP